MTDPKLQTTADLAQQLRDVIPPAPHFLAMLEELERRAAGEWRPIETAPKDGSSVVIYGDIDASEAIPDYAVCSWEPAAIGQPAGWVLDGHESVMFVPTHWMPLPSPPEDA